jgi:3-oxoacyl-[acyl-carrier protein] reductase
MQPELSRRAIIFGHTSGLGLALARQLTTLSYEVIGVARSSVDALGASIIQIAADLATEDDVHMTVRRIQEEYSAFDALIYTAGALTAHEIEHLEYADLDYLYRINVFAPMVIESSLFDLIKTNGADVVNVTSSSVHEFYPKFAEYATSKAAFAKFTSDLQRQLKDSSARVTDLCPSGFTSNMYARMFGQQIPRDESVQIRVEDLADLVCFILKLPKRIEVTQIHINRK